MIDYINDICPYVTAEFQIHKIWQVLAAKDVTSNPYTIQFLLRIQSEGCERPGSDVLLHLQYRGRGAPLQPDVLLWSDRLWQDGGVSPEHWKDPSIVLLTYLDEFKAKQP